MKNVENMSKTVELLAPAGDWERLEMSVAYGADAVYLAGSQFGMRSFAGNFDEELLKKAVEFCHSKNVEVYVTCNTSPRNEEMDKLPQWLEYLQEVAVDSVIVGDMGVLSMVKQYAPKVPLHISTQANIINYQAANMYYDLGASRVILARELSLEDIRVLREKTPKDLEIEAFVHGSMCMSYSGRCLLSSFMTGRDANRGSCAQPCRYGYSIVEETRPGEYFPIVEENGETFLLNSRDMCMIDHLEALLDVGVCSFKIEGRAKSAYYAGVITGAYRHGLDAAIGKTPLDPVWRDEVEKISHRDYSTGFFFGEPGQYIHNAGYQCERQVIAVVESCEENGLATLSLRNKFATGDLVELIGPDVKPVSFTVGELKELEGELLEEVRHPQMKFTLKLPCVVPPLSMLRREI